MIHSWNKFLNQQIKTFQNFIHRPAPTTSSVRALDFSHFLELRRDCKAWISIAKISFAHREQRDWKARVDLKPKLRLYKIIKTELKRETNLDLNSRWKWKWLARMRSGTSDLRLETGRWEGIPVEKRICRFCVRDEIESEEHILLSCFLFQESVLSLWWNYIAFFMVLYPGGLLEIIIICY